MSGLLPDAACTRAWTRGYPLETLRRYAGIFRERHKALVFGAFGLTREREVAEAMKRGRFVHLERPAPAAALFRPVIRPSEWCDFRGYQVPLHSGDTIIEAIAGHTVAAVAAVLSSFDVFSHRVFAEVFEEDEVARRALRERGFGWLGTRIGAGSEIKGLYAAPRRGWLRDAILPFDEVATLSILRNGFVNGEERAFILHEVELASGLWEQHYSSYNKRRSWTAFALHGYDDDPRFVVKPAEMSKRWKEANPKRLVAKPRWTSAAHLFPITRALLAERLRCQFDRVRFMRLRARDGELSRHADVTDREAGVQDGCITRLHIPIVTSDAVTFYGWTARGECLKRHLPAGALCYLDQRKPHAVTNRDQNLNRIHLVVDCVGNAALRKMIAASC